MAVPIQTLEDTTMPQAAEQQQQQQQPPPQPKLRYSQRHRQKVNDMREEQRTENRLVHEGKLDRVQRWIDDCQRAKEEALQASTASGESSADECQSQNQRQQVEEEGDGENGYDEIDGDTEDLLLSVLVARPEYHTVPTAGQVRQFARELRVYKSKLWTLDRTRGYFRGQSQSQSQSQGQSQGQSIQQRSTSWGSEKSTAPQSLPEYPSDIDDEPDLELDDGEDDNNTVKIGSSNDNDNNNNNEDDEIMIMDQTPPSLYLATSRELSPVEEELQMEMLHEYQQRRRSLTASKEVQGIAVEMDVDGDTAAECPNFVPVEAC